MTQKELAQKCVETINGNASFENHLGVEILEVDRGKVKLKMQVKEFMLNGHRTCQGGAIFSFADAAFAYACNGENIPTVAYSCDITYLRPAFEDDVLIASAREVSKAGRNGIYDVDVTNQKGEVIAHFLGKSRALNGTILKENE